MTTRNTNLSLLILWPYYYAVGHYIELLQLIADYKSANSNMKIFAIVNDKGPFNILEYSDITEDVYPINVMEIAENNLSQLDSLPNRFDFVIYPQQFKYKNFLSQELDACFKNLIGHFKGKIWSGYSDDSQIKIYLNKHDYSPFSLNLPTFKLDEYKNKYSGHPIFSIILKGASLESFYPTLNFWSKLCKVILKVYPNAIFLITGISKVHTQNDRDLNKFSDVLDNFIKQIPNAFNCYDVGLENQMAIIAMSNVFIAPHTGFAFLAPCLGTPWLALSGGEWAEQMPAQVPFYSVLPRCNKYPCNGGDMKLSCRARLKFKQPIKCMSSLDSKLDDILFGIEKLLNKDYKFDDAFDDYQNSAISNNVNLKKLWRISAYKQYIINTKEL